MGGLVSDRAAPITADVGPGKFLRYAALVTENTPGSSAGPDRVPPRYGYAIMAGINRVLYEDMMTVSEGAPITIPMARFEDAMDVNWVGTPKQLETEMAKLAKKELLREEGKALIVSPKYSERLVRHGQVIFEHMTGRVSPQGWNPATSDWVRLNAAIFKALFYAEFGLWWSALRAEINVKLRRRTRTLPPGEQRKIPERAYKKDHIAHDTALWVVINLLSRFEKLTDLQMGGYAAEHALGDLAGSLHDIADAVDLLAMGGVIVGKRPGAFSIAPDLEENLAKHAAATTKGMSDLDQVCRQWEGRQPAGRQE